MRRVVSYFSPRGRISRETYVRWVLAPWIILGAGVSTVPPRPSFLGSFLLALLFWAYLVGFAKRIQDFGFAGFPISAVLVIGLWLNLETSWIFPAWLETYLYALLGVGMLFAASTPGQPGPNRYGPDPLVEAETTAGLRPA